MIPRIDFTSQAYLSDPAASIERLRTSGPIVKVKVPIIGKVWITTTYELAGRVLKDSETFTSRRDGGGIAGLRWIPGIVRALADNMLTMDEPGHTRLRGIVDEQFSTWSRASCKSPASSPASCLRTEARLISLTDMRESCRLPSSASCSACRLPTGRNSPPGRRPSRVSPGASA